MEHRLTTMISEEEIIARISEIAEQINRDYAGQEVHLVCVLRGGSYWNDPQNCRSANRNRNDPDNRNRNNGFRLLAFQHAKGSVLSVPARIQAPERDRKQRGASLRPPPPQVGFARTLRRGLFPPRPGPHPPKAGGGAPSRLP